MKILALSLWILFNATPAFANPGGVPNGGFGSGRDNWHHWHRVHAAPAPLLGVGIP